MHLPLAEYHRLLAKAGEMPAQRPALPSPNACGRVPAIAYMRASIAREIIQRRKAVGLSQIELARQAGLQQVTISHVETGRLTATPRTIERLDKALRHAERQQVRPAGKRQSA